MEPLWLRIRDKWELKTYPWLKEQADKIYGDNNWQCCCGLVHVKTGAFVVAILGILLTIGKVFGLNNDDHPTINICMNIDAIITLFLFAPIIYAHISKNESWYLPYIIVKPILILLKIPFLLVALIVAIVHFVLSLIIVLILFIILFIWFWLVIFQAYRYVKEIDGGYMPV